MSQPIEVTEEEKRKKELADALQQLNSVASQIKSGPTNTKPKINKPHG